MNSTPLSKGQIVVSSSIFALLFLYLFITNLPAPEQPHYPDRLVESVQSMAGLTPPNFKPQTHQLPSLVTPWLLPVDYEITGATENPKDLQSSLFGNFPEGPKHLLLGSFQILNAIHIEKPFPGVAISLQNTQAPKEITERWQVVWYIAADGNTNRKLRQALADSSGSISFDKSNAPWVCNIEPAGKGNRGVISVFTPYPVLKIGNMALLQTDLVQGQVASLTEKYNQEANQFQTEDASHQTDQQFRSLQSEKDEITGLKHLIQVNQENLKKRTARN